MSLKKEVAASNGEKKRAAPDSDTPNRKKLKSDEKNPLVKIHELFPGLQFNMDQEIGPSHNPTFVMSFEVFGRRFSGTGNSKKQARINAAMSYLASADKIDVIKKESPAANAPVPQVRKVEAHILKRVSKHPNVNPLMLMNEIHKGVEFEVSECLGSGYSDQRFKAIASLEGKDYTGYGASKKIAKGNASARLLNELYNCNLPMGNIPWTFQEKPQVSEGFTKELSQAICKAYASIALGTAGALPTDTLAAVVMSEDNHPMQVVAMAIGSSGIIEENISLNGAVLNDSHSEVLVRRSLISYLYSQLEALAAARVSIFYSVEGKPVLRPSIKFHLYLSNAPCGACHNLSTDTEPKFLKRVQYLLSYKVGNGNQTLALNKNAPGKKSPKILDGKSRLFIMSCTDKLTRWQCIGLQGALLSHIIPPVYYETIVFGKPYQQEQLYYTLCGRIENKYHSEPPHSHKLPILAIADVKVNPATGGKVNADTCMAWYRGMDHPELIIGITGKLMNNNQSCLSKYHLFKRFKELLPKLKMDSAPYTFYCSSKMASHEYQKAKGAVSAALARATLGYWSRKPVEQEQFTLEF